MVTIDPIKADCDCCRRTTFGNYGLLPYGGRLGMIFGAWMEMGNKPQSPLTDATASAAHSHAPVPPPPLRANRTAEVEMIVVPSPARVAQD
jgi:hypothetical protein